MEIVIKIPDNGFQAEHRLTDIPVYRSRALMITAVYFE